MGETPQTWRRMLVANKGLGKQVRDTRHRCMVPRPLLTVGHGNAMRIARWRLVKPGQAGSIPSQPGLSETSAALVPMSIIAPHDPGGP